MITQKESSSSSWRRGIWIPILALPVLYAAQDFLVLPVHQEETIPQAPSTIPQDPSTSTRVATQENSLRSTGVISKEVGGQDGDEPSFMASGDLIVIKDCPFALNEKEAERKEKQTFERGGNNIELTRQPGGRAGNHFMLISGYLAMGFCCGARLVTLPATDNTLHGDGPKFQTKHRWFGFSDATVPWDAYQEMRSNREICMPDMKDGGDTAFGYKKLNRKLIHCMNQVFLRGCEAEYLGEMVQTSKVCRPKSTLSGASGAGSLVVHIRSGDIFDPKGAGGRQPGFGQPPLEFFLMAMRAKNWDDVTVVTSAPKSSQINPTFRALETMDKAGSFGMKVRFFSERSLQEDLREMLCADAIASSKTSLSYLTFAHTRAKVFFVPSECGPGAPHRTRYRPWKATYDNTTLLMLERPDAEVYGVEYDGEDPQNYTVYKKWQDTPEQLLEMVTYSGIKGLRRCGGNREEGVSGAAVGD